jgi:hypothetical protein
MPPEVFAQQNTTMNLTDSSPMEQFEIEEHGFNTTTPSATIGPTTNITSTTQWPNIHSNVLTDFDPNVVLPEIQESAFIQVTFLICKMVSYCMHLKQLLKVGILIKEDSVMMVTSYQQMIHVLIKAMLFL